MLLEIIFKKKLKHKSTFVLAILHL